MLNNSIIQRKLDKPLQKELNGIGYTMENLVNYGENIFRKMQDQFQGVELAAPFFTLMTHMLNMLDGISILVKKGSSEGILPLCRSMFETSIYFKHMYNKPLSEGAIHYQVCYARKEIKKNKSLDLSTIEGKKQKEILSREMPNYPIPNTSWKEESKYLLEFLNKEQVKPVNDLWDSQKREPKNWYTLSSGAATFRELTKMYNMETYYVFLYRETSEFIHGSNTMSNVTVHEGKGYISLRKPDDIPAYCTMVFSIIRDIFFLVEGDNFLKWFEENVYEQIIKTTKLNIITDFGLKA
ncbi:DUF5677 domain-containing protein [Bacillus sp. PS194]|uniref:DUF5677 domain-containing protein n=1 Tax=Bacillus TaxID=1386 RepID=UPI00129EF397|nr:DUF5677 domain-containing protein [Bacillus subtilis]MBL3637598.1 hypothetical protein [Alkalicoccobacillus gibsonii]MCM3008466.1 DUF5677 domain-containing protein [Bacillus subtilis]MDK8206106.1 DUF5677 domain-containing protein [Bacillus subtilis]QGI09328.1 hypothetical protein GII79_11245 [Bacillus subtilis]QGI17920.1 hypothetical protein GII81_11475 [Bacillus subtilis]